MIVVADMPSGGWTPSQSAILDRMISAAGQLRSNVRVVQPYEWENVGTIRHNEAVVLAGERAVEAALGWEAAPDSWHGSVLPFAPPPPDSYKSYREWCVRPPKYVVTYSIANVTAMYEWHPLALRDWEKAGEVEAGRFRHQDPDAREWVVDTPSRLCELEAGEVIAFDTELTPYWIFGACNDKQVHVTEWRTSYRDMVEKVMQDPKIVKVAHNLQHDLAMCDLKFDIKVTPPWFDTMGGAQILNTALEKTLSPGISARFTNWPYHKWLGHVDTVRYNGMDNIVCYDAYHEIAKQLKQRKLWDVAQHDHKLLEALYDMSGVGLRINNAARKEYETTVQRELVCLDRATQAAMRPVVRAKVGKFRKPHLFTKMRQCACCGGGKLAAQHCWRCGGLPKKPKVKADFANGAIDGEPAYFASSSGGIQLKSSRLVELRGALPACRTCGGDKKRQVWRRINPGSDDQVADVLYRGLNIPPRKYKGIETTRADALAKLAERQPLVRQIVEASKVRADLSTVERLTPDPTTRKLHTVFDPWGTASGRVASREGLLLKGTNLMNIPKAARRFVVPDEGMVFLYPDKSQVEARVVAVVSKPYGMELWNAFKTPIDWPGHPKHGQIDSHTFVQQMVSEWVEISRDQAKRTTFAVIYGATGDQLAIELTNEAHRKGEGGAVSAQQGEAIVQAFYKAFPGVLKWQDAVREELLRTRTVRSLTGRERHWPGRITDKHGNLIREVVKEGWSYIPQDTGAWVLAEGLMRLHEWNKTHRVMLQPLVHVHDAVLMQAPTDELPLAIPLATAMFTNTMFGMDFPCAMKTGTNWYEAS